MNNLYTERKNIDATHLDIKLNMSIPEMMRVIEEATFNHSHIMGLDHDDMVSRSNAFWIVNKIKIKIINPDIKGYSTINVSTWTHPPGVVRFNRDSSIKIGNKIMVKGISEWCCLDATTRRPRKASSIHYPSLELVKSKYHNMTYSDLKIDVEDKDYIYTHTVRSTDLDVNNHTNNLKYNYIALNAFTSREIRDIDIREYEIHFVCESYEGDEIHVYRRKVKNMYYIQGQTIDKVIFRVIIKCKR